VDKHGSQAGVVNENLRFLGHERIYACDLSVFPTSPAANPTLTLAALAIRLADHLRTKLTA
jgi:choline dehydrogenase-like flavoprotein